MGIATMNVSITLANACQVENQTMSHVDPRENTRVTSEITTWLESSAVIGTTTKRVNHPTGNTAEGCILDTEVTSARLQ
jgi:hypothetical protein